MPYEMHRKIIPARDPKQCGADDDDDDDDDGVEDDDVKGRKMMMLGMMRCRVMMFWMTRCGL